MTQPTYPTIPEVVWVDVKDEVVQQYTMCYRCGPDYIPTKIFYIKGTSYCPDHARDVRL